MAVWYIDNAHRGWLRGLIADGSTYVNDASLSVTFESVAGEVIAGPFAMSYFPASSGDYYVDLAATVEVLEPFTVARVTGQTPQGWQVDIAEYVRVVPRAGPESP